MDSEANARDLDQWGTLTGTRFAGPAHEDCDDRIVDRNLFVDDWIDTGGQALAVRGLVEDSGAYWLGAAVIVDDLADARLRRDLGVRSIQHGRDIWPQPNLLAGRASRGGPTGFNTVSRHRPQARDRAGWET